ncbi:DsbA family protein [Virgifigura deserti]|uniref:DsbA family protein n=1 Tax=Virgifigura deserti TaxID=2268457 RepID=UPI003CCC22AE
MRNFWAGAAVVVVLGVAVGGWQTFGGNEEPESPISAVASSDVTTTETPPATVTEATASTAPATVQLAQDTDQAAVQPDDRVLGEADAPVTIIEYASLTCPHCASFHSETLPKLKSEYIDKGQVRLVFRDFPLDQRALRASMLARCMPENRYFSMLDVLFRTQRDWATAEDPMAALSQIARLGGMSQEEFDRCMANEAMVENILTGLQAAQSEFDIRSTPSFIVDGTTHAGALSFEQFDEILKDLLPDS